MKLLIDALHLVRVFGSFALHTASSMAASMSHAAYFDSLVDMIPAKHYLDPEKEPINIKHMKKADKKAAKRALKAEGRKNKRQKLDPSMAATTLEQQQQRAAEKEQAREAEKEEQPSTSEPALNHGETTLACGCGHELVAEWDH